MYERGIEISKKNFNKYGKKLKLFPGVNNWFKRINKFVKFMKEFYEFYESIELRKACDLWLLALFS